MSFTVRTSVCARRAVIVAAVCVALACVQAAFAGILEYAGNTLQAELRGDQITPPVPSAGIGAATFVIDRAANTLTYRVVSTVPVAEEVAATINGPASPGQDGPVLHSLPPGVVKSGVWRYPQSIEDDLTQGRCYVLISTKDHPTGQLRGQIGDFVCKLTSNQVVPPASSSARGWGTFTIDREKRQLTYYIWYTGLSSAETGADIMIGELHGSNTNNSHPLAPGNPKVGVWNYQPGDEEFHVTNGRTYVLIRTEDHPDGEVRGQISPLIVPLDGQQMMPPVETTAIGIAHVSICTHCNAYSYFMQSFGLSSAETGASIHGFAPVGENAPPLEPLEVGNPKLGTFSFGGADEPEIMDGLTYFSVRTAGNSDGEIRGQVYPGEPYSDEPGEPADLNGDGFVNAADLAQLLGAWSIPSNTPGCDGALPCPADLTGDGFVNAADLAILLGAWTP